VAAGAVCAKPRAISPPLLLPPRICWPGFLLGAGTVDATQDHNVALDFGGEVGCSVGPRCERGCQGTSNWRAAIATLDNKSEPRHDREADGRRRKAKLAPTHMNLITAGGSKRLPFCSARAGA
jgi:hypothetical protein